MRAHHLYKLRRETCVSILGIALSPHLPAFGTTYAVGYQFCMPISQSAGQTYLKYMKTQQISAQHIIYNNNRNNNIRGVSNR